MIKTKKPLARQRSGFLFATRHNYSFGYNNYNSNRFEPQSKILRVNKKNPCKICGRPDWCSYTQNGELALCMRVSAGSIKTAANNAFIHVLNPQDRSKVSATSASSIRNSGNSGKLKSENNLADADTRHEVYTYLLECLNLNALHGSHLIYERGLHDRTIASCIYASVPEDDELERVMAKLRAKFGDRLKGVAGFYKDSDGLWQMRSLPDGFFVPYRDVFGRISGIQIRRDAHKKPKYFWFSTPPEDFREGTSSGSHLHFTAPDLAIRSGEIIITEGALKADSITIFMDEPCVALAGVTTANFDKLPAELKKSVSTLRKVKIAYDADFLENEHVKKAIIKLSRSLRAFGFEVDIWTWNPDYGKGLDDLLRQDIGEGENND